MGYYFAWIGGKDIMKKAILFISALVAMAIIAAIVALNTKGVTFGPLPDQRGRTAQIFSQEKILKEGDRLVEQGLYDEALEKYDEALAPEFISHESDKASPLFRKVRLFRLTGHYSQALDQLEMFLKLSHSNVKPEIQNELEVLFFYQQDGAVQPVLDYIAHLKNESNIQSPPNDYSVASSIPISTILRLYDTIGDHDAGIAYIDMILNWTFEDDHEFKHLKEKIRTVHDADECMTIGPRENPDWHACKWLREYLLVREAFEQDKAEGKKGRATQALIQSDYFPW
jgi:tetratricopeptide (TPR) repeat protein